MTFPRVLTVAGALMVWPALAQAQQESAQPRPLIQFGGGGTIGVPIGDFSDNVDIAGGLYGHVGFGIGESPFSVGVEGTLLFYGTESRDIPLVGFPNLTVPVRTSNNMALFHGRLRAQKPTGRVRPYVDGLAGFNYISTRTSVDADDSCDGCDDDDDSFTNVDDLVFSAGAGIGVMVALGSSPNPVQLDLAVRYLYGGEASYFTDGVVNWQELSLQAPYRTRTDMIVINLGVAWGR